MKATLRKRGDKYLWQIPYTVNGRRRYVSGTASGRRAAQAAANTALARLESGSRPPTRDKRTTVEQFLTRTWPEALEGTGDLRASTLKGYRNLFEVRVVPRIGGERVVDIDPVMIETLKADLLRSGGRNGLGLSPQSVRNTLRALSRALGDAVAWGLIERNPARGVRSPKSEKRAEHRTWTAAETLTFLDATAEHPYGAAFLLALTAGLRRGEVLGLRWSDVILDRGTLAVRRSVVAAGYEVHQNDTKTGHTRTITLMAPTVTRLREFRRRQLESHLALGLPRPALVVTREDGGECHPQSLSYYFEEALREAGLPRIRFHDCRHTCATVLLENAAPMKVVQEMLGHSSIQITSDVYGHVTENMQQQTAALGAAAIFGATAT